MKMSSLIITGLLAGSLSACGASIGGLAQSMAKKAAVDAASAKIAPQETTQTAVVTEVPEIDSSMDCAALSAEIQETDAAITAANETLGGSAAANVKSDAVNAGASYALAKTGAAGAVSRVPFGGLFAKSAKDAVAKSDQKKIEQAKTDLQNANMRKASLTGLYAGKKRPVAFFQTI